MKRSDTHMRHALTEGAVALGIELSARQLELLCGYAGLLGEWNQRVRLVADGSPDIVARKHLVDSLACIRSGCISEETSVVDVGSGAGLPGIPLAIAVGCRVTLVESVTKKTRFLVAAKEALGLQRVDIVNLTAEEAGRSDLRAQFDCAVARAVAPLPSVLELCMPLVRVGGCVVAQKGAPGREEVRAGGVAAGVLGGSHLELVALDVGAIVGARRCLVVCQKECPTPERFPRRPGLARRRPLAT